MMMDGKPCWLVARLPSEWAFLPNERAGTMVLLHASGLWTEVDALSLLDIDEDVGRPVVEALEAGRAAGLVGRVAVEVAREGSTFTASLRSVVPYQSFVAGGGVRGGLVSRESAEALKGELGHRPGPNSGSSTHMECYPPSLSSSIRERNGQGYGP